MMTQSDAVKENSCETPPACGGGLSRYSFCFWGALTPCPFPDRHARAHGGPGRGSAHSASLRPDDGCSRGCARTGTSAECAGPGAAEGDGRDVSCGCLGCHIVHGATAPYDC